MAMKRSTSLWSLSIASLGLLLGAMPLAAHHSFAAEYDDKKPVKVTGIVKKVEWTILTRACT